MVPEIGAKIVSLRNLATGREWMWRPHPDAPLFRNEPTDPFDASPLIGADECLPTIAPCRWNGRDLPDHGEVWAKAWQVDELTKERIRTSIRLQLLPLLFERTVSVEQNQAFFEYALTNCSGQPQRFVWAFHPLMSIEDGDQIDLPDEIRSVHVAAVKGLDVSAGCHWAWPQPMPDLRLDRIDFGNYAPAYAKLFANFSKLQHGFAAIRRGREKLSFWFDPAEIPFLGLWFTRGGWNGYTHMAIEPTNAATDLLLEVAPNNRTVLEPFQTQRWSFHIVLETS